MPDITDAERIRWQIQAASLLTQLLERAAKDGLPAIAWTVSYAGAGLAGACYRGGDAQRRRDFGAWRAAVIAVAGPAGTDRETAAPGGEAHMVAQWNEVPLRPGTRYPAVRVTLTASLWADDEEG